MTFSIITISFNSEKTIERTIKSVLAQTNKDYEYIIVDGASKDCTLDIVKKYEPLFEGRMKWKSEPDTGIYNAMNKGVKRSTGELIGIVNSDDWLEQDAIEQVVKLAEKTPNYANCIFCGSLNFHYQDGSDQVMESDEERFYKGMKRHSLNHGAYHPSMFVGKMVYETIGLFDENYKVIADTDFIDRCYDGGVQFIFTKAVINNMSDGGASNKMNLKRRVPDKIYGCKKKGYGTVKTYYQTIIYIAKLATKSLIGESLMKRYRYRSLK